MAMKLVAISPERDHPREHALLTHLFVAGLERFHVRKPHAAAAELESYVRQIPAEYWSRVVLHQHHELVDRLGLGGRHWRDDAASPAVAPHLGQPQRTTFTSRSCHDLATLRASLGRYDSVFFGPVFPSISKPGYGPTTSEIGEALGALLTLRTPEERRTVVIAIGGIDSDTAPRALALGFDGVAVLGAVWQAEDPVAAFLGLRSIVGASLFATPSRRPAEVANQFAPTTHPAAV